jgi:predicted transcriptional regulator
VSEPQSSSETLPAVDPGVQQRKQEAFLLNQVAQAPDQKLSQGEANKKIPATIAEEHKLDVKTANEVRESLVERGLLQKGKEGRSVTFTLTGPGRTYLDQHKDDVPAVPEGSGGDVIPASNETIQKRRTAYLLRQVLEADPDPLPQGDANKKTLLSQELELNAPTANHLRAELVSRGLLNSTKGRTVSYTLTDTGRKYLDEHKDDVATVIQSRGRVIPPSTADVRQYRVSYLLLQLLKSPEYRLTASNANKFDAVGKHLALNVPTATKIRHELKERGLLTITEAEDEEVYTLTAAGRLELGAMTFDKEAELKVSGAVLNDLLEAAREAAKQFEQPVPTTPTPSPVADPEEEEEDEEESDPELEQEEEEEEEEDPEPEKITPERIEQAIITAFDDIRRKRHLATDAVPIHEVRAEVLRHLGEDAVRHDTFDKVILGMRGPRFRLTPITDPSKATHEQLQASIAGTGETLFYLELAPEPAVH